MNTVIIGVATIALASALSIATGVPDLSAWERLLSGQVGFVAGAGGTVLVIWKFVAPRWNRMCEANELVAKALAAFVTGSTAHTDASKEAAAEVLKVLKTREEERMRGKQK